MRRKKYLTPEELGQETQKLIDYKAEMKHLYASDGEKRLYITGAGNFIVEDKKGKILYQGVQPFPAIDAFFE